ncbi:DUF1573 domain-containing protein, partial [Gemmata algarum]|uniref:DUF1573 domain-containing protein n=1 Tax=Gemmata algarum TaxID=2975278 RepID=UPI0038B3123B
MLRRRVLIVTIIASSCAAAGGAVTGRLLSHSPPSSEVPQTGSDIVVAPEDLDFGDAWADPAFVRVLRVHNTSQQTVQIERWRTSCDCAGVQPTSLRLEPGETQNIQMNIDLTRTVDMSSSTQSRVEVPLAAVIRGRDSATWVLRGRARPLLVASGAEYVIS